VEGAAAQRSRLPEQDAGVINEGRIPVLRGWRRRGVRPNDCYSSTAVAAAA
jgi:hypothetical protein